MKLLIVDDNCRMREMMKFYLAGVARETRECSDGAEALAAYRDFRPDWVLMDIEMERMDGLTATAAITRAHPEARVLIVTNHDSHGLREEARRAGARDYVLKENLLDVRRLLRPAA